MSKWLREHAGRVVTEGDVAEIFTAAYGQAANMKNAVSGFKKVGCIRRTQTSSQTLISWELM